MDFADSYPIIRLLWLLMLAVIKENTIQYLISDHACML